MSTMNTKPTSWTLSKKSYMLHTGAKTSDIWRFHSHHGWLTSAESQSFMPLMDINIPFMFQTVKNNLPENHNGETPSVFISEVNPFRSSADKRLEWRTIFSIVFRLVGRIKWLPAYWQAICIDLRNVALNLKVSYNSLNLILILT